MKLMVGKSGGSTAVFLVDGATALNLTAALPGVGPDLMGLITAPDLMDAVRKGEVTGPAVDASQIVPALPVAAPGKIMCLGLNYVEHVKEGGYDLGDYPAIFMRTRNSIMAAGEPMVRPRCSDKLDYEAELMIVIGKGGRYITEADALDHVFGYTVFNDGSLRDYQRKTHQWTPGKNFDNTGAIGPSVVTPDDLPAGAAGLKIESRVGDEILQSSNTGNMIWSVAQTIAIMSEFTTLEPGDLIAMGTPPGVGHAKKPHPRWLKPGETVEIEIERIGICASPVVDEADLAAQDGGPVSGGQENIRALAQAAVRAVRDARARLDDASIDVILRDARSHYAWTDKPVPDALLHEIFEITIAGPTSMNCCPARFVFVRSQAAKARLAKSLKAKNIDKMMAAPVTAIIAYDPQFWTELPFLFPHEDRRPHFEGKPEHAEATAFRNSTLQGAYFMIAARALGLDVGAMSGFSNAAVDAEFFAENGWKSNFLCNIGYADETALFQKLPRFGFDQVCSVI